MRTDLTIKNVTRNEHFDEVLSVHEEKVIKRLKRLKEELAHLSVHAEKNPHKEEFYCSLNLFLPAKVIHIREKHHTLEGCVVDSFSRLLIQIDKYKHKIEKHLQKRRSNTLTME
jgi:ribosome-associated translation inhibitor RaiA